jgi:hypothetical protein
MKKLIQYGTALLVLPFRPGIKQVLALVNPARRALGLGELRALPAGAPGKAASCPLSIALGGFVGAGAICFEDGVRAGRVAHAWNQPVRQHRDGRYLVDLPPVLRRFVKDFDLGAFPGLANRTVRPPLGAPFEAAQPAAAAA